MLEMHCQHCGIIFEYPEPVEFCEECYQYELKEE